MKLKSVLSAVALASAALAATSANAAFINGSFGLTGQFDVNPVALTNLPGSMVSALTSFSILSNTTVIPAGTNSYASFLPLNTAGIANNWTLTTPHNLYVVGGFNFNLTSITLVTAGAMACNNGFCLDSLNVRGLGTVTGNGFFPTLFSLNWTANGNCLQQGNQVRCDVNNATLPSANWSANITSNGVAPTIVPEPASLALVGLALVGLAAAQKSKKARKA